MKITIELETGDLNDGAITAFSQMMAARAADPNLTSLAAPLFEPTTKEGGEAYIVPAAPIKSGTELMQEVAEAKAGAETSPEEPTGQDPAGMHIVPSAAVLTKNPKRKNSKPWKALEIVRETPGILYEDFVEAGGDWKLLDLEHVSLEAHFEPEPTKGIDSEEPTKGIDSEEDGDEGPVSLDNFRSFVIAKNGELGQKAVGEILMKYGKGLSKIPEDKRQEAMDELDSIS